MLDNIVTHEFRDPDIVRELKRTVVDRAERALAREVAAAEQMILDETPVPYDDWPEPQKGRALVNGRIARRLLHTRCRNNAHLHATLALLRTRYGQGVKLDELTTPQIRAAYHEAKTVVDTFLARLGDYDFWYLNGDTRDRLEQAANGRVS